MTHENFLRTKNIVNRFQRLNEEVQRLGRLMDELVEDGNASAHALLVIHYQLFQLEKFKDETLYGVRNEGPALIQIVAKYFRHLDQLSQTFRNYMWKLASDFLSLISQGKGSLIVAMLKIIEIEELEDEKSFETQQTMGYGNSRPPMMKHQSSALQLSDSVRTIKNYRSHLFNILHDTISEIFARKFGDDIDDIQTVLEEARFVYEDLSVVCDDLVPRFPPQYKIFPFFVLQYHKNIYDLINRISKNSLETRDILSLTSWIREYYKTMEDRLGVSEDLLEPRLLDDRENVLIEEYVKVVRVKLIEWVDRLQDTEEKEFISRENPPECDSDGLYITSSSVILFQMINQQIDISIETRVNRLLREVALECYSVIDYFLEMQGKMLDEEFKKFMKNPDAIPGFPEYTIALINNHWRCMEFLTEVQGRIDEKIDEDFKELCQEKMDKNMNGFTKIARNGRLCLIDVIFRDISPAFESIFLQEWYDGNPMGSILATLGDYFSDFEERMQDALYLKFVSECQERFLVSYLNSFTQKGAKFKIPISIELIKKDLDRIAFFWSDFKSLKRMKHGLHLFEKILDLLECSPTMIFLSWYSLWKAYNDVPISFIEEILSKRSDLDRSTIKEVIANCKAKARESSSEGQPSIFSKRDQT